MKIKNKISILLVSFFGNIYASAAFPGSVIVNISNDIKVMKLIGDEHFYWYEKENSFYRYDKASKKYLPIMITEDGNINNVENRSSSASNTKSLILKKATKKDLYKIWAKKRQENHAIIK